MSVHTRIVRSSTILSHPRKTLLAEEWAPAARIARLRREQKRLRECCEARVDKLEKQIQRILRENDDMLLRSQLNDG